MCRWKAWKVASNGAFYMCKVENIILHGQTWWMLSSRCFLETITNLKPIIILVDKEFDRLLRRGHLADAFTSCLCVCLLHILSVDDARACPYQILLHLHHHNQFATTFLLRHSCLQCRSKSHSRRMNLKNPDAGRLTR